MTAPPFIEEIQFDSPDYQAALGWRDRILRRPLGLALNPGDTKGEDKQRHFVLRDEESLFAGVIAMEEGRRTIRLRQMWVRDDMAGKGLGRTLIEAVEQVLKSDGFEMITLNARIEARGFYGKCGYGAEGEVFEEIGIPHIRMTRHILPE